VELQLGYAVFSALRQIHGQTGVLLGVQSPGTSPLKLLEHMECFLSDLPGLVEGIDEAAFIAQRQALADQLDIAALPLAQAAELLWQGKLAGRSSDYLSQLTLSILAIDRSALLAAAYRLKNAEGGWRGLASSSEPQAPWQVTK
jgi:secreted Zn-dependent insulinase-like peptidase